VNECNLGYQGVKKRNSLSVTIKRFFLAFGLSLYPFLLVFAQTPITPFQPIGLPSSRSSSPVFNRYASLPPFTAVQPEKGEWFCIPTLEFSQGMTAAFIYDADGFQIPATMLDYETLSLELPLSYGLTDTISLEMDLQFQYLWGGKLDAVIESFHGLFGFLNGGREIFNRDRLEINIPTLSGFDLRAASPSFLVSDPIFGVALGLVKTNQTALTGRIFTAVPLGLGAGLSGAELPQIGSGLYLSWTPLPRFGVNASLGGILPLESFGWTASHPFPMAQARLSVLAEAIPGLFLFIDLNFHSSPIRTDFIYSDTDLFAVPNADLLIGFLFTGRSDNRSGRYGSFTFQEDPITHNASDITFIGTGAFRWR